MQGSPLAVTDGGKGRITIAHPDWAGFAIRSLGPSLRMNGVDLVPEMSERVDPTTFARSYTFSGQAVVVLHLEPAEHNGIRLRSSFRNISGKDVVLNRVVLLGTHPTGKGASFGNRPEAVRLMAQGNYWGRVVPLVGPRERQEESAGNEPTGQTPQDTHSSELVSVVYDRAARMAFLAGFETSERWLGRIEILPYADGNGFGWRIGFDAGDLLIGNDEEIAFETVLFLAGPDPWALLETYATVVANRHNVNIPPTPPVSWCSWYPYRLSVTEGRILENARIAAERLKPLGLTIIEIDLGWETGHLPSTFEENERFPHGLKCLSEELGQLGFEMGVWKGPFTISEFDPLTREHPEWLIRDANGEPAPYGTWFWSPHGKVFILDLTHPGAQEWLRQKMTSLAQRGVRYFKADFIGCVSHELAKNRHNKRIVSGGGTEAARIGAEIIREALPDALLLNCGGPEMPGKGHWPLLYTCDDTGNTGFLSLEFQRKNYQTVACHLFKNRRWGILQPSCLCVGLPGTVQEARLRATAAFLVGGQIDISDTLTTLPEERWRILTATLPPLGITARPVDLFEPVYAPADYQYAASCKEEAEANNAMIEHPAGSVWHVHVKSDWDEWDLVGVFAFDGKASSETPEIKRFRIPLSMLGLSPSEPRWGYEFWSSQVLGLAPAMRQNPNGYAHPGDFQDLAVGNESGILDIAFSGPDVKLICLRSPRPHPWILGTGFHQSCGAELANVSWDPNAATLAGELHRPPGEMGFIVFYDSGKPIVSHDVEGQSIPLRRGPHGSWFMPVAVQASPAHWRVSFQD